MLNKIIEFSIQNKLIVGLFVIALIGYGSYEVTRLPIDAVPDITNNQVQIITVAPALGATDVERLITVPIEQINSNIPHLKELRSFSSFGLSVITVVVDDEVDVYLTRQQIAERLQQVQDKIPKGLATPFLAPVTTGLGEIYQYVVRPEKGYEDKYNAMELRSIQDWIVRKQLLGVKGVAEVSSFGGLLKQYEISVEPNKLLANGINIGDVFSALEKNNQNTGGSYIEKGPTALFIKSEGLVGSIEDIQSIVIKNLPNGIPLLIRDVAEVRYGNATRYGALTYNGELQVSGAVVLMLKGENSNKVIADVKSRIEVIQQSLPEGVVIEPFIDRTKMVNNAISTVTQNLMEGALIVIFVLVLFLGNFRAGLLVASVIPLSMLFAIVLMNLFGVSGNLMSLGALDFGLIVDGAVIIVESVMHSMAGRKSFGAAIKMSQGDMDKEVKTSASRMMNSAVFGQIIILIVYLPIFTLKGIEGKMFKPMAQTVAFALAGAFVLSISYIPMMSALFLSKKLSHQPNLSDKMMHQLETFYKRLLERVLAHPKKVIALVFALFAIALVAMSRLGGEFIPSLPEGDFAVEARVLTGSNLNTSIDVVSKASKILLEKFPEVERVVAKTGSSEVPTDPMPIDASDMIVVLKSRSEWTSATNYADLELQMIEALAVIPGVKFSFQYPVAMRFNELISGAKQDVVCKIYGDQLDSLANYAQKLGNICNTVEGSSGIYVEAVSGLPQINIQYHRSAIAQYGLNISDVNNVVNAAFAGQAAGTVYEGERRFDLVVRLKGDQRKDLIDVQNLLIPTPSGKQVPLNILADVNIVEGPNQIQRENGQRRIIVGFNVRGRDVQSMVEELQQKVNQQIKLPARYFITYGGAFENLAEAKKRLYIAVPVSLVMIFILLFFAFRSVKQGLLIYSAIPLSAIGGILALTFRGISFSISAGVGFIALFGVAVLNGIVLIAEFNRLKEEDSGRNLWQIVLEGTKTRLRPVLMTAMVASLGFLPMAVSTGEGAEVQRPLATVVIGGLLLATLLTLFVLPILYMMFHKNNPMKKAIQPLAILMLMFTLQSSRAQRSITLQQALDSALANNLTIRNEKLKSDYQQKMIKAGINVPATNVTGEYGQINSFFIDKKFGVSQSMNFPTVYARQHQLLKEEWKSSVIMVGWQVAELKKAVSQVYYTLIFLQQKKSLLQKNDSLFSEFLNKTWLRFNEGESNLLEKTTVENQRGQIAIQLMQVNQDLELIQMQFQLLLNTQSAYEPNSDAEAIFILPFKDSIATDLHPAVQYYRQRQKVASVSTQMERSKLMPDLTFSYSIMGMRGTGADNITYDAIPRFQSGAIGLGIPIFTEGQRARLAAAKAYEKVSLNEFELNKKNIENGYLSAKAKFQMAENTLKYYQETGLKNAMLIQGTANQKYAGGEINYLEWVMLIHQAILIQSDYIEALKNRNLAHTELQFYTNQ